MATFQADGLQGFVTHAAQRIPLGTYAIPFSESYKKEDREG